MADEMTYFPAEVEMAVRKEQARKETMLPADFYLDRSGGRLACPHPVHRFAQVPGSPARVILPECAGRERWLEARRDGIGGSEVGALIGVSEYETAFSVYNTKINGGKDLSHLSAVEWGHRLENVVAEKTAEEIGLTSRFGGGLWARTDNPILRVTPDRFATKKRAWKAVGVIECKTSGDDDEWQSGSITAGGQGDGRAPLSYQAQLQWQLGILGLKKGWLGCYVSNRERSFFTVEVDFNFGWFDEMVNAAVTFWQGNVLKEEPPMHDLRHPKTEELLKQINPVVVHPSIDLPDDADVWLKDLHQKKLAAEKAEADLNEAKNFFRMWTGDAGAGYWKDDDGKEHKVVSYPTVNGHRVDVEMLKEKYPDVAKAVTVESSYRRLTITVPKNLRN